MMMRIKKTDEELICAFMEPRPPKKALPVYVHAIHQFRWWANTSVEWVPARLTLNECHEVEKRLTDEQRKLYTADLTGYGDNCAWRLVHATAEQKIAALASVLRKEKS